MTTKMLASTVQFSSNGRPQLRDHRLPPPRPVTSDPVGAVRCEPVQSVHEAPTTIPRTTRAAPEPPRVPAAAPAPRAGSSRAGPFPQDPTARLGQPHPPSRSHRDPSTSPPEGETGSCTRSTTTQRQPTGQCSTREHHPGSVRLERGSGHSPRPANETDAAAKCSLERR